MPNIAALLKEEITRLSRKEVRRQLATIKKASVQSRRHVAALRRQVGRLERQLALMARRGAERMRAAPASPETVRPRFVAKGLRSHRARVGLSAQAYGRLAGVSAQTIYSWERKASTPRAAQRAAIASLRGLGKREVLARLREAGPRGSGGTKRSRR
jgi:DNA-binding transcriptional regulator YiaG